MPQIEPQVTSTNPPQEASNDTVFSPQTREEALRILSRKYGSLAGALGGPVKNVFDWVFNIGINPSECSSVIKARQRFNQAANDATHQSEQEKKVA